MQDEKVFHRIPAPYSMDETTIEVYGDGAMGRYEWRVINAVGKVLRDSKDRGYGNAEIALRDALIALS
jgi:hypothetical protein